MLAALSPAASAEPLRIATWHADLSRKGPGLLLRDIDKGTDPDIVAIVQGIVTMDAEVLLLSDIDHDLHLVALTALRDRLAEAGADYPHLFALRPNGGRPTGLDLDGDRRLGGPRDAQGFGYFNGQGGLAILSRLPVDTHAVTDLSGLLWRDVPFSRMLPEDTGTDVQRLSSAAHWNVPVLLPGGGALHLLVFHATTPVFDGPEDRNGRRNADEVQIWQHYLDGALGLSAPDRRFLLLGNANLDPVRGEGLHDVMRSLLSDPRLRDPAVGTDTANWPTPGPGPMRVSYALPSVDLGVVGAGQGTAVGAHRPVWLDIDPPP